MEWTNLHPAPPTVPRKRSSRTSILNQSRQSFLTIVHKAKTVDERNASKASGSSWHKAIQKLQQVQQSEKIVPQTSRRVARIAATLTQASTSHLTPSPLSKGTQSSQVMRKWLTQHRKQPMVTTSGDHHDEPLSLEEVETICRSALKRSGDKRSPADITAIQTWLQRTKLLQSTQFHPIPAADMERLCHHLTLVSYYCGELVCEQSHVGSNMYIIFSGHVDVHVRQETMGHDSDIIVASLSPLEFFGEQSLVKDAPRSAKILTTTFTELVQIHREEVHSILKPYHVHHPARGEEQPETLPPHPSSSSSPLDTSPSSSKLLPTHVKILRKKPNTRTKKDLEELAKYLISIKYFHGMVASFIREVGTVLELLTVDAYGTVFEQDEVGSLFYIILSGSVNVNVKMTSEHGRTQGRRRSGMND